MKRRWSVALAALTCLMAVIAAQTPSPNSVVYDGASGPGRGKHIVFLAGDHEYRSEETLPELARMLSRHYGFRSSVLFTTDADGAIDPGSSRIAGMEALRSADLLVIFLRFQDFPDAEMQYLVDYLDRGGPVVGLRTATHSFQIRRADATFRKYTWNNQDPDYRGGFGRQILGETWVSHYGTNHEQSSRLLLQPDQLAHPVLRGVKDVWAQSGGYTADPMPGSQILAMGEILDGMRPDAPAAKDKKQMPVAWVRTYVSASGKAGRVFTTTHGASEDLLNEGFRRLVVNACLWAAGLDSSIRPDNNISLVGPYQPTTFGFGGFVKGMKPADLAGWDTPIPAKK